MKKVIFICLLTLSVCLSKPADQTAAPPQTSPAAPKASEQATTPAVVTPAVNVSQAAVTTNTSSAVKPEAKPTQATTEPKTSETGNTVPKTNEEAPKGKDNNKVEPNEKSTTDNKITEKPAIHAANVTTTAPPSKKETTTEKLKPIKPSEVPAKEGEKPTVQARGFDGPSFIGGIILTLGLLAIGFMGFKYYKNQTERNYHTL